MACRLNFDAALNFLPHNLQQYSDGCKIGLILASMSSRLFFKVKEPLFLKTKTQS